MKSNFLITDNLALFSAYKIAQIDGLKAQTLRGFYEEIAKSLEFPDYFGFNLDSLDELLNDLSWIKEEKVAIFINNSQHFIEKERNPEKFHTLLDMLDATAEDWKWTDEAQEHDFPKKDLIFIVSKSERMEEVLKNQGVSFEMLS